VITIDTSAMVALLDRNDVAHDAVTRALRSQTPPYLLPTATLGELGYFIETRFGHLVLDRFMGDLVEGSFGLDCGHDDVPRVRELVDRYRDLPLGLVAAAVVACAERSGRRVLTLDQHDFSIVGRAIPLTILPTATD
jgi:predicted nucleic acid-binding protein